MKIVLDNTILVRAHERAHGLGRELLTSLIESKHVLLLSNEMLHELARVCPPSGVVHRGRILDQSGRVSVYSSIACIAASAFTFKTSAATHSSESTS